MTETTPRRCSDNEHRLIELRIRNYGRIEAATIHADGRHVLIRGRNSTGKTTAVQALWDVLDVIRRNLMPQPVRSGERRSEVTVDLGPIKATRVRTKDGGSRISVVSADGEKQPLEALRGLVDPDRMDVARWVWKRPQDQIDDLLRVADVTPPVDEVREITGDQGIALHLSENADDFLARLSADETGQYFVLRRDAHVQFEAKRAALAEAKDQVIGLPDTGEPESPAEVSDRLDVILKYQQGRDQLKDSARDARETRSNMAARFEESEAKIMRTDDRIAQLLSDVQALKQVRNGEVVERNTLQEKLDEAKRIHDMSMRHLEELPDRESEADELRAKIRTAQDQRDSYQERVRLDKYAAKLAGETNAAEIHWRHTSTILDLLRDLRRRCLEDIDIGVDGLRVEADGVYLNNVPVVQCGKAEAWRLGLTVAMRQRPTPRLKLLWLDGGEAFDRDMRADLLRMVTAAGWQAIVTIVDSDASSLAWEIVESEVGDS